MFQYWTQPRKFVIENQHSRLNVLIWSLSIFTKQFKRWLFCVPMCVCGRHSILHTLENGSENHYAWNYLQGCEFIVHYFDSFSWEYNVDRYCTRFWFLSIDTSKVFQLKAAMVRLKLNSCAMYSGTHVRAIQYWSSRVVWVQQGLLFSKPTGI